MTQNIICAVIGVLIGVIGSLWFLHRNPKEAVKLSDELIDKISKK